MRSFESGGGELRKAGHELLAGWRRAIEVRLRHIRCFCGHYYRDPIWNTVHLEAAIARLRSEGVEIDGETLAHLSPALWEHINPYGRMHFDVEAVLGQNELRPLREPEQVA